jgi:hypothetical protein
MTGNPHAGNSEESRSHQRIGPAILDDEAFRRALEDGDVKMLESLITEMGESPELYGSVALAARDNIVIRRASQHGYIES